jgi:hypothetical protein
MTDDTGPNLGRLIGVIALFALIGIPMVAYLWEVLNRIMAGHFDPVRIGIAIPVFLVWLLLLRFMARHLQQLTA